MRQRGQTLAATLPAARARALPRVGVITIGATTYQVVTLELPGLAPARSGSACSSTER